MSEAPPYINIAQPKTVDQNEQTKELRLSELTATDVLPGNELTSFKDFRGLMDFTNRLAFLLGQANSLGSEDSAYYMREDGLSSIKASLVDQVQKRHFYGFLQNFSILMLLPDMIPNLPQVRRNIHGNSSYAFLLDAEMHSSGQGLIGHARRVYGMYITSETKPFFLTNTPDIYTAQEIAITSRQVDIPQLKRHIGELKELSRLRSRQYYLDGLRKVISGGLPSLGKSSR